MIVTSSHKSPPTCGANTWLSSRIWKTLRRASFKICLGRCSASRMHSTRSVKRAKRRTQELWSIRWADSGAEFSTSSLWRAQACTLSWPLYLHHSKSGQWRTCESSTARLLVQQMTSITIRRHQTNSIQDCAKATLSPMLTSLRLPSTRLWASLKVPLHRKVSMRPVRGTKQAWSVTWPSVGSTLSASLTIWPTLRGTLSLTTALIGSCSSAQSLLQPAIYSRVTATSL